MAENDRLEIVTKWTRNHPVMVGIIILGAIIIYLGSFTDSLDKIITFREKYFSETESEKTKANNEKSSNEVYKKNSYHVEQSHVPKTSNILIYQGDNSNLEKHKVDESSSAKEPAESAEIPKKTVIDSVESNKPLNLKTITPTKRKIQFENPETKITQTSIPKTENRTSEVRPIINASVTALSGETTSDRVNSVRSLLPSLPSDLSAKEIAKLLGSETISYREAILKLLVTKTQSRSLNPSEIPLILASETTSNRIRCIEIIAPYIKGPIPGFIADEILGSETSSYRVRALRPIAPIIKKPLKDEEIRAILNGTSTSDRTEAIKILFGN